MCVVGNTGIVRQCTMPVGGVPTATPPAGRCTAVRAWPTTTDPLRRRAPRTQAGPVIEWQVGAGVVRFYGDADIEGARSPATTRVKINGARPRAANRSAGHHREVANMAELPPQSSTGATPTTTPTGRRAASSGSPRTGSRGSPTRRPSGCSASRRRRAGLPAAGGLEQLESEYGPFRQSRHYYDEDAQGVAADRRQARFSPGNVAAEAPACAVAAASRSRTASAHGDRLPGTGSHRAREPDLWRPVNIHKDVPRR